MLTAVTVADGSISLVAMDSCDTIGVHATRKTKKIIGIGESFVFKVFIMPNSFNTKVANSLLDGARLTTFQTIPGGFHPGGETIVPYFSLLRQSQMTSDSFTKWQFRMVGSAAMSTLLGGFSVKEFFLPVVLK